MSWLTNGARIEYSLVHTNFCVKKSRTKKDLKREKRDREESKKIGSGEQKDLEREKMINYVRQICTIDGGLHYSSGLLTVIKILEK